MTPALMLKLRRCYHYKILLHQAYQIIDVLWQDINWQICCTNRETYQFHCIWLSTGIKLDITLHTLCTEILHRYPILIINGLPVLDRCLAGGSGLFLKPRYEAFYPRNSKQSSLQGFNLI